MTERPDFDQPTTDELLQEEPDSLPMIPIPVNVEGPVRIQQPGARRLTSTILTIGPDQAEVVVGEDPRRSSVKLYATTGTAAFFVGPERRIVNAGRCARFNSGVLVELHTTQELYVRSATAANDVEISIIIENWSD